MRIDDAGLDSLIEPLEPQVSLGRAFVRFGGVLSMAFRTFPSAVKK